MTAANYLTVRDYFDQALVGMALNKRVYSSQRVDTSGISSFDRLLTSRVNQQANQMNSRPTGLTVVDYLNNPVRAACRHACRTAAPTPDPNAAKPTETADASPAMNAKSSATGPKALSRTPKRPIILKKPAALASPPNQPGLTQKRVIEKSIHKAAQKYNLPAALIRGVIRAESNFEVTAVSRAGAQGLMQLMPGTARELGVDDPFDIQQNIDGGARYLRRMLDSFGGNIKVALAAYNAGPGTVERHGGQIPPYQETARYIDRVLKFSKQSA